MTDASESLDTPPDGTHEAPSATPTGRKRTAKKGTRAPAAAPALLNRHRLTDDLTSGLHVHEAEVTQALEEVLSPFVEDGEPLQPTPLLRAVGRLVEARQHQLRRAHLDHADKVRSDKKHQQETRQRFQELRRLMVDLRQNARSLYGRTAVKTYLGFDQPTGREPLLLLRQAQNVLHNIQDPDRGPPPGSRRRRAPVDLKSRRPRAGP